MKARCPGVLRTAPTGVYCYPSLAQQSLQEACQSGRMGLTANELSSLKGTGGSNPLASAMLEHRVTG